MTNAQAKLRMEICSSPDRAYFLIWVQLKPFKFCWLFPSVSLWLVFMIWERNSMSELLSTFLSHPDHFSFLYCPHVSPCFSYLAVNLLSKLIIFSISVIYFSPFIFCLKYCCNPLAIFPAPFSQYSLFPTLLITKTHLPPSHSIHLFLSLFLFLCFWASPATCLCISVFQDLYGYFLNLCVDLSLHQVILRSIMCQGKWDILTSNV